MTLRDYRVDLEFNLQDVVYSLSMQDTSVITEFIIELANAALEWEGYRALRDYFTGRLEDVDDAS